MNERERSLAHQFRTRLLPAGPVRCGPWVVRGRLSPAHDVGGDAYDAFVIDEYRFVVAIADASETGMVAALHLSNLQAMVRAACNGRLPFETAVERVNGGIWGVQSDAHISACVAEVDTTHGVLRYANAGHPAPLLRRSWGAIEELTDQEPPFGVLEAATYADHPLSFHPGDALLLYSDGVIQASGPHGEAYGIDRLRAAWARVGGGPPEGTLAAIFAETEAFRGSSPQRDDLTIVVVGAAEG